MAPSQNGLQAGTCTDVFVDRVEPAIDAAVERVVVLRLEMRLVRLTRNRAVLRPVSGMAPAAIAASIGHVGV